MKKHHPPSLLHPFTAIQTPPQGRKENAPKLPKNSPKMPLNHPHVTFRPIKPCLPPLACNTNVASMLHYIRFVFFRPMSFHTPNPLSINANHDFTASSCYVRFVLCPVFASLLSPVYKAFKWCFTTIGVVSIVWYYCSRSSGILFQFIWNIIPYHLEWGSILEVTIRFVIKFIVASGKTCLG